MNTLRLTSCMSEHTDPVCHAISAHIQARLGVPTEFEPRLGWDDRMRLLQTGHIHAGWICGLPYALNRHQNSERFELLAAPVMQGARYGGKAVYFADVMVNRQKNYHRFSDLKGMSCAYNEKASFSGYLALHHYVLQLGLSLSFFGDMRRSGTHHASLSMLVRQQADCAAIDSTVLDMEALRNRDGLEALKAVETLGPYPIPPWVISTGVPGSLRRELRAVLLEMHLDRSGEPALRLGGLSRFTPPDEDHYDAILDIYETVAAHQAPGSAA